MFSSPTSAPSPHSTTRRLGVLLGAGIATSFALSGVAQAHVEVQPASVPGGGESVIAFRVPDESDSASTVGLKVVLPKNTAIASVQTTAIPGWTVVTKTRKLAQPIKNDDGEQVTSVVSQVTWRATGDGIVPGQYQDFDLALGTLPPKGKMVFNAVQTYSDGTVVNWNEVSADKSVEPEHPAPTLTVTPAAAESPAETTHTTPQAGVDENVQATPATTQSDSGSDSAVPVLLAGTALVVSLLTALLVWRRGRSTPVVADAGSRQLEDSKV